MPTKTERLQPKWHVRSIRQFSCCEIFCLMWIVISFSGKWCRRTRAMKSIIIHRIAKHPPVDGTGCKNYATDIGGKLQMSLCNLSSGVHWISEASASCVHFSTSNNFEGPVPKQNRALSNPVKTFVYILRSDDMDVLHSVKQLYNKHNMMCVRVKWIVGRNWTFNSWGWLLKPCIWKVIARFEELIYTSDLVVCAVVERSKKTFCIFCKQYCLLCDYPPVILRFIFVWPRRAS